MTRFPDVDRRPVLTGAIPPPTAPAVVPTREEVLDGRVAHVEQADAGLLRDRLDAVRAEADAVRITTPGAAPSLFLDPS